MQYITFAIFIHFSLVGSERPPGSSRSATWKNTGKDAYKWKKYCGFTCFPQKVLAHLTENSAFWQLLHSWPETAFSTDGCAYHVQNTADWKYVLVGVSRGHSTQSTVARIPTWRTSLRYDSCKSWNNMNIDFPWSQKSGLEPWLADKKTWSSTGNNACPFLGLGTALA